MRYIDDITDYITKKYTSTNILPKRIDLLLNKVVSWLYLDEEIITVIANDYEVTDERSELYFLTDANRLIIAEEYHDGNGWLGMKYSYFIKSCCELNGIDFQKTRYNVYEEEMTFRNLFRPRKYASITLFGTYNKLLDKNFSISIIVKKESGVKTYEILKDHITKYDKNADREGAERSFKIIKGRYCE